jgi:hypothetical protein
MNLDFAESSSVVHIRQGFKSLAHSSSQVKWTLIRLSSPLKRTLAISPEINFRAGFGGLPIMVQEVR